MNVAKWLCALSICAGACGATATAAEITIDAGRVFQTWVGAGTSISGWGSAETRKAYLSDRFIDAYTGDMGMTVLRVDLMPTVLSPSGNHLIPEIKFVRNKMKTGLFGPEHVGYGKPGDFWLIDQQVNYVKAMAANGKAVKHIDAFAIHGYGGDGVDSDGGGEEFWRRYWDYARQFAKPSWQTETGGGEHRWQSLKGGGRRQGPLNFAVAIIDGMTIGDVSLWCNWQFWDGGDATEHNLLGEDWNTGNPKYSVAKHFFRYVRPGAVRLGATVADARSLNVAAWRHRTDGTYVLLSVNLGDTQRIELGLPEGVSGSSEVAGFVTDAQSTFPTGSR